MPLLLLLILVLLPAMGCLEASQHTSGGESRFDAAPSSGPAPEPTVEVVDAGADAKTDASLDASTAGDR
jgi:hypothetical protein